MLAAGMRGVAEGYELPVEADANLFEIGDEVLAKLGIEQLPQSLSDALRAMEASELVHEALGEHIFEWFLRNKRTEWRAYKTHVSTFEIDRYLRALMSGCDRRQRPARRLGDPVTAGAGPHARPRRLPLEGGGHRRRGRRARAARRLGRGDHRLRADATGAWAFARTIRKRDPARRPCWPSCPAPSSPTSSCATSCSTTSASRRSTRPSWRPGCATCCGASAAARPDMIEYRELSLNLETYQASIAGRPLDLTYMEYELLKFLAQNPGKVFTREMLLNRVWGYEYYGGARTVDVHVRRLRAKLGEEHAGLIQTVRSVGYRFGQSRWGT